MIPNCVRHRLAVLVAAATVAHAGWGIATAQELSMGNVNPPKHGTSHRRFPQLTYSEALHVSRDSFPSGAKSPVRHNVTDRRKGSDPARWRLSSH